MEKTDVEEESGTPPLPPPPTIPTNVKPEKVAPPKRSVISRRGVGTDGRRISLLTNHFRVSMNVIDAMFYQYSVRLLWVS